MKRRLLLGWAGMAGLLTLVAPGAAARGDGYAIEPAPLTAVQLNDPFWSPRLETNRSVTLRHLLEQCGESGQLHNFAKAGGLMAGEFRSRPPRDSDIYKILEGAAFMLAAGPDPALEKELDELIAQVAAAQEPDGYLYTARRLLPADKLSATVAGPKRWLNEQKSHELYVAGHLYEAGAAHFRATGSRTLLDVAIRNADLVAKEFGPGRLQFPPGHQGIEIGLASLFRATGDRKYVDLARFFIELRGRPETHTLYGDYGQDHRPVVEQEEAVGHAVRACYLYAGMADVAALTADSRYGKVLDRLWNDVVSTKLSLTGGIGPRRRGEAFGDAYELPNLEAYNETCAALAAAIWSYRMFQLEAAGKYVDVFERIIYNGMLSGVSLSGDRFFYENPLASRGGHNRVAWFETPCCPTNLVRFLPTIPGYVYATGPDGVYVNLFAESAATLEVEGCPLRLTQSTRYPWEGRVTIAVDPERPLEATLCLRVPGWARNEPVPSDLYRVAATDPAEPTLRVNAQPVELRVENGYARLHRRWEKGDSVELDLPMPIRRVLAHPAVKDDAGRVALQRGPLVYCVEGVDHGGQALNLGLADDAALAAEYRADLLGGVTVIRGDGLTAIPYYAWGNRGDGEMAVWLVRRPGTP